MKKLSILIIAVLISFHGISQDSLPPMENDYYFERFRILNTTDSDSLRIKTLNDLANHHKFNRSDSGIYYALKGLRLAQEIGDKEQEMSSLHFLALSYHALGNSITAYRINLEGLRKAEEYGSEMRGQFLMNLGRIMQYSEKFEDSREYYLQAVEEFDKVNNKNFYTIVHAHLAITHIGLRNIDSAFIYSYKAKQLAESRDVGFVKRFVYSRLGDVHNSVENIDSALFYFKLSDSFLEREFKSASIMRRIAEIYTLKNQPDSALFYAEESLDIALINKQYQTISESAIFFSDYYKESNPSKALEYSKLAIEFRDSLEYINRMTGFEDLISFDELQRQAEIERSNQEFRSKLRTYIFMGSLLILLIIASFLYRNNRTKHKAKIQIEGAYNQLKSTQAQLIQSEKMASLGELTAGIAHEIQNPLNFVNNFSEVSSEMIEELDEEIEKGDKEEAKAISADIKENLNKITFHGKRADAIVKGMLEHSKRGSGQKELTNLNALADEFLRLSYQSFLAKQPNFKCEWKTDLASDLPEISVIPQDIGKVLLNLINNAFYAVHEKAKSATDDYSPEVIVSSKKTERGIELSVQDNGTGIPDSIKEKIFQPFFTTKPTGSGTGLGLSLSYDIIKAHGGEIIAESIIGQGAKIILVLPNS
ncbi:sensor histidine kinase [Algoriphagus namhaensis]|uniref:histidine kinase n=1 Tax=Algoriphagus namhaensis TaxID=915353 RepID=A0ABV8APB3_9BACT